MKKTVEIQPEVGENSGARKVLTTPATPLTTPASQEQDMAESHHSSTSGKSPAFQFYPKDFLTDEHVALMSLSERGAYITLLCICWTEGSLPSDPKRLSRLCGVSPSIMRRLWVALETCFRPHPSIDGRVIHPRLDRERISQAEFRRRQSDNGRKGGRPHKPTTNPEQSQNNPSLNSGLSQTEPKKSSSSAISDLQSADCSQNATRSSRARAVTTGGVMAGSLPRDHLRHSWCGRVCVPDFLHAQFERSTGQSEEALKAFYANTFANIPEDEPVEPDAVKFWRPRVSANWPPADIPTSDIPAKRTATDWWEQCKALHGGTCTKRWDHEWKMRERA